MRGRTTVTAATTLAAVTALLTACGGGGSGNSGKASSPPSTTATTTTTTSQASPAALPSKASGASLEIDPSLALPADFRAEFGMAVPRDPIEAAALSGAADFLQAIDHAVAKQNRNGPGLRAFSDTDALRYAQNYVQANVADKETLTGTDRYYRPVFTKAVGNTVVDIKLCNNQSKLYSKKIATGKVHVTQESVDDYVLFDIFMIRRPSSAGRWQANGVTVKERSVQCER